MILLLSIQSQRLRENKGTFEVPMIWLLIVRRTSHGSGLLFESLPRCLGSDHTIEWLQFTPALIYSSGCSFSLLQDFWDVANCVGISWTIALPLKKSIGFLGDLLKEKLGTTTICSVRIDTIFYQQALRRRLLATYRRWRSKSRFLKSFDSSKACDIYRGRWLNHYRRWIL